MFEYGATLSGWWLLWNRLNPFAATVCVPSMGEINSALMWVSSERHLDRIRRDPRVDLLLRPPVQVFSLSAFRTLELPTKKKNAPKLCGSQPPPLSPALVKLDLRRLFYA